MKVPDNPKIFHIVHIDHLYSIIHDGGLFSDAIMSQRPDVYGTKIGMDHIKERRMQKRIGNSGEGVVGEYVPFYFCPRSVMLYIMYKSDHSDITYRGGQEPIIHLVSDVNSAIKKATEEGRQWLFTDKNAGTGYAEFFNDTKDFDKLQWDLIKLNDFRPQQVKDAKQSEFLVKNTFPWELITHIVVYNETTKQKVEELTKDTKHKPVVKVIKEWYY